MTCDFTSFSTVFQSYQDDGQVGDNGRLCAMEPCLRLERSSPQARLKPGTARPRGLKPLSYQGFNWSMGEMSLEEIVDGR